MKQRNMDKNISYLLTQLDIHPILLDIGASRQPPQIWEKINRYSIYLGFDPDSRDIPTIADGKFYKKWIINKAVIDQSEKEEIQFYLTKFPHCSSTLEPDLKSLQNFLFHNFFIVERKAMVNATTLDSIMHQLSISFFDWVKLDTQGTDLRLFNSLNNDARSKVLAVDLEPGLIDAYVGEDLFIDVHRQLTQNGFWLSNLNVGGAIRMRESTLQKIKSKSINQRTIQKIVKESPAYCEVRYFRTLEWMTTRDFKQRDYVLLYIFALLDRQLGFALDIAVEYERIFGKDDILKTMYAESVSCIIRERRLELPRLFITFLKDFVKILYYHRRV